jgi:tape measure domain-containing protein
MAAEIRIIVSQTGSGNAVVQARRDVEGLGHAAEQSGGGFSAFQEVAVGALRQVGASAVNVALAGVRQLAGGMIDLIRTGIDLNASMEQTTTAFTTLLGSGEAARSFLEDLRAFAAATPFEFPELADAAKKLLAMGFAAEDVVPMMTNIGDAVAALGGGKAEVDRVTMALGQMRAKGKVSAEEMMQLAELGIPAWQMLADAMGLSTAEVMKLSERGLIPADQAITALRAGMQSTFGGAMQDQSRTFNGLLSTLRDNAAAALQAFSGPLFETAKSGLLELGGLVASPQFQAFAVVIGQEVGGAIANLAGWLRDVLPSAIQGVADLWTGTLQPAFVAAAGWFAQLQPVLQPLIDLISTNLEPILVSLAAFLGGALVIAIASAVASILTVAAPIAAAVAAGAALYAAWQTNFGGIQTIVMTVMTAVQTVIQSVIAVVVAFWQANGAQITADTQTIWNQIYTAISTAITLIQTVLTYVLNGIAEFIKAHGTTISSYFSGLWTVISGIVQAALALITGILQAALALWRGDFSGAWDAIKTMSAGFVSALLKVIQGGLEMIKSAFALTIEAVKTIFNGLIGDARGIGAGIIDGIVAGVKSAAGRLAAAAVQAAKDALDAVKSIIQSNSPSRVFAMEVGAPMAQGMAVGLLDNAPMVARAAQATAGAAIAGGRSAVTNTTSNRTISFTYNNVANPPGMDYALATSLASV